MVGIIDIEILKICDNPRWLVPSDYDQAAIIEQSNYTTTKWTKEQFKQHSRQRDTIGIIIEYHANIEYCTNIKMAGFIIYQFQKDSIHIVNLGISPDVRRKRVGTQAIQKIIDKLKRQNRREITVAIDEANVGTQLFFYSVGFTFIRTIKHEDGTDKYLMKFVTPPVMSRSVMVTKNEF